MKQGRRRAKGSADLRRRAEARLREQKARGQPDAAADPVRLLHELEVHQVELEIQNEELRAARLEVEAGLARYTELFDFAPIGYFVLGGDGAIREANLAGARLLDTERGRLVGRPFSHFVAGGDNWSRFLAQVLSSEVGEQPSQTCELTLGWVDHAPIEVHLTATALPGASPTALVAMEDVTRRKQAETRVHEESRHKDEFLAVLSHELRNPLTPIVNSLAVLERVPPGGAQANKAQAVIGRQVAYLTHIVNDLLDVTRIARGKVRLQRGRVELGALVRQTLEDHRPEFESGGLRLEGRLALEPLWLEADATRIVQVLGNLLTNAFKFTPRGGRVEVELRRDGPSALLAVRDTGVGIAPEVRSRLFEPFRQAPQTLDRTPGGLGLGLAMVKGLVELHGGTVEVASEGLGRGAQLTVRLPLQEAPAEAGAAPTRPAARHRILVIEDNPDAASSLKDALELGGHEVVAAHDGPSGLALARVFRPGIVICDIGLPGMDGYEVARTMRAEGAFRGAFLVALTGYALAEDVERAAEAGFDRHVPKPPDLEALQRVIAEAPRAP